MSNPVGRPLKYTHFFELLENETVYCPFTIYQSGKEQGFVTELAGKEDYTEEEEYRIKLRIRHTLLWGVPNGTSRCMIFGTNK